MTHGLAFYEASVQGGLVSICYCGARFGSLERLKDHRESSELRRPTEPGTGCRAALNIKGEHYPCDVECVDHDGNPVSGHDGWIHSNKDAQAIWCGGDF